MSLFLALGLGGYTPELFPTAYRFRGSGLAQMAGRAGLIATPYAVVLLFGTYGIAGVVGTIATMYVTLVDHYRARRHRNQSEVAGGT